VKYLAAGSALVVALATSVGAQDLVQPPPQAPTSTQTPAPVFRAGASLVALNVTVTDGRTFVPGLQPDDFAVYEDGVQQHVQFFESKSVPVDLILLIDTSSSMREKMDVVHEAALGFLKTLRDGDRGAVVAFSDGVNVVQALTSDRHALDEAIKKMDAHGATALNNALYVAMKQFGRSAQQNGDVRRQAIAVLSDGEDTSSLISFDDVLATARKSGINIYTIALQSQFQAVRRLAEGGRRYFSESDYAMKTLARETGARSYFPEFVQDLKRVYADIADELANQYSIGYSPSNPRPDGRFRRIVVRVNNHPEFQPRARAGYTAEGITTASAARGGRQ
jgi:Ca-activated chloride channel family protein